MNDRLKRLLTLVIEEVIETGEPVGSQHIVESHDLDVSSATIRNWFAELEQEGYIVQPHTSAGRVPTEKGYRFYISDLMQERALRQRERKELSEASNEAGRLARMMAELGRVVVILDRDARFFTTGLSQVFAKPEFKDWNMLVSFGEMLDRADDLVHTVDDRDFSVPTALIGQDCPFGEECGAVLIRLHDGTLIGLLGPMRMDYRQSFALLKMAQELTNDDNDLWKTS